jgi:hypothetical protein
MRHVPIALSSFVGALLCVFADLGQKQEASAILAFAGGLSKLLPSGPLELLAILFVVAIAVAMVPIFDVNSKKAGFYLGASVLSIAMTVTPYRAPPGLKTGPNSVEINVVLTSTSGDKIPTATISVLHPQTRAVLGRAAVVGSQLRFFQDGGSYTLLVEAPGYKRYRQALTVTEGSPAQNISVRMEPTETPLFIQRIIR